MKKITALVLAVLLVFALSVSAFALESPTAPKAWSINVSVKGQGSANSGIASIDPNNPEVVILQAQETTGAAFVRWEITGPYTIVSGSLTTPTIKIMPSGDISAVAIFEGGETQVDVVKPTEQPGNTSGTSPKTGDMLYVVLGIMALAAVMGAFATRKVRG